MARKKVKLAFIHNDSARKATFKKRKKGLLKKVYELTTLCGVDACAIIFSRYDSEPAIFPPDPAGVQRVLSQFQKMPEMEQMKKMVDQDSFLTQRILKADEQLKKLRKDNKEKETTEHMFDGLLQRAKLQGLNMVQLNDVWRLIDQNLEEIYNRMETLNKGDNSTIGTTNKNTAVADHPSTPSSSQAPAAAAAMATSVGGEIMLQQFMDNGGSSSGFDHQIMSNNMMNGMQKQPQWLLDLINQPQVPMGFGGEEMMFPYGDAGYSHNNLWTNAFYQ